MLPGSVKAAQDALLIEADEPWRLAWLTSGLYEDGWTKPGKAARIRVYSEPGQRRALTRFVTVGLRSPGPTVPVNITSSLETSRGPVSPTTVRRLVRVCVPAHGFGTLSVQADGDSPIPSDLSVELSSEPRQGGVLVSEIAIADEIGPECRPGSG